MFRQGAAAIEARSIQRGGFAGQSRSRIAVSPASPNTRVIRTTSKIHKGRGRGLEDMISTHDSIEQEGCAGAWRHRGTSAVRQQLPDVLARLVERALQTLQRLARNVRTAGELLELLCAAATSQAPTARADP